MKEIFIKIEEKAKHMQDLRDDKGHAETVTNFAKKLCNKFKANEEIVIPAAILHDIGYYGMDKSLLKDMMAKKLSEEQEQDIKIKHMENGAILAEKILNEVNYDKDLIKKIILIIKRHDLKDKCTCIEEKIVRDADKLARFSKIGFYVDIKRRNYTPLFWYDKLKKNFDKENYFQTEEARQIAIDELEDRKKEFSNQN